ncbi:MAG: helix-turn-helix domain-containing protein [Proteobacteria bacterium]|nr:helix-turn-helix domain-containing protein [Pseudomonadota bacterium]
MQTETRLLPFEKACVERLGIGKSLAWNLARDGKIKTVKLGRLTMVKESEIARFISSLENEAA